MVKSVKKSDKSTKRADKRIAALLHRLTLSDKPKDWSTINTAIDILKESDSEDSSCDDITAQQTDITDIKDITDMKDTQDNKQPNASDITKYPDGYYWTWWHNRFYTHINGVWWYIWWNHNSPGSSTDQPYTWRYSNY